MSKPYIQSVFLPKRLFFRLNIVHLRKHVLIIISHRKRRSVSCLRTPYAHHLGAQKDILSSQSSPYRNKYQVISVSSRGPTPRLRLRLRLPEIVRLFAQQLPTIKFHDRRGTGIKLPQLYKSSNIPTSSAVINADNASRFISR